MGDTDIASGHHQIVHVLGQTDAKRNAVRATVAFHIVFTLIAGGGIGFAGGGQ
ncbi:hypothetical protein D3C86_2183700 [compost metagenome]